MFGISSNTQILIASNPPYIGIVGILFKFACRGKYYFLLQDIFPESAEIAGILGKMKAGRAPLERKGGSATSLGCTLSIVWAAPVEGDERRARRSRGAAGSTVPEAYAGKAGATF